VRLYISDTATDPLEYTGRRNNLHKREFRNAEINPGGNRTLMYRQVTSIAEHDRVDVFPLSIITNGTGGILRGQRTVVFGHPLHLQAHKKRDTSQLIVLCLPVRTIPSLSGP
jgi:hypothetical protein